MNQKVIIKWEFFVNVKSIVGAQKMIREKLNYESVCFVSHFVISYGEVRKLLGINLR